MFVGKYLGARVTYVIECNCQRLSNCAHVRGPSVSLLHSGDSLLANEAALAIYMAGGATQNVRRVISRSSFGTEISRMWTPQGRRRVYLFSYVI